MASMQDDRHEVYNLTLPMGVSMADPLGTPLDALLETPKYHSYSQGSKDVGTPRHIPDVYTARGAG